MRLVVVCCGIVAILFLLWGKDARATTLLPSTSSSVTITQPFKKVDEWHWLPIVQECERPVTAIKQLKFRAKLLKRWWTPKILRVTFTRRLLVTRLID